MISTLVRLKEISHPDRVMFSPAAVVQMLQGEDPVLVIKAIDRGVRGEFGDVYRIDGVAILGWISKQKKEIQEDLDNARKMNFFNNY